MYFNPHAVFPLGSKEKTNACNGRIMAAAHY